MCAYLNSPKNFREFSSGNLHDMRSGRQLRKFNWQLGVLLNLYRDGNDGVAWHSDREHKTGKDPIITSVTFGETRMFRLRHKFRKDIPQVEYRSIMVPSCLWLVPRIAFGSIRFPGPHGMSGRGSISRSGR